MMHDSVFARLAQENRTLFLYQEIDGQTATELAASLILLDQLNHKKLITIYINSPGGHVDDGLLTIYDTIQNIKAPVKTICCGIAYSSAAVILAAGTNGLRCSFPHGKMMLHQASLEDVSGTQKEIIQEGKRIEKLNKVLLELIARHTSQSYAKIKKHCNKDKYFSAKEALNYGIIDEIIEPHKSIPELYA